MDEDKPRRMMTPMDVVSVSGKPDAFVSSIIGTDTPPTPQGTVKKNSLESETNMSMHQKSVPESPSSSVSPQKSVTSRAADESLESLMTPLIRARLEASRSETQPSTRSVLESKQTSHASTSTLLCANSKDRSPTQDIFSVPQADCTNLISLIKIIKHSGKNASSQKSEEIGCLQCPSQMKVGRWDSEGRQVAVMPTLASGPSVASTEEQIVGYLVPPEELVPSALISPISPNDTRGKQPGKTVHPQSTDQSESQVTSSLGVAGNQISDLIPRPQRVAETDSTALWESPLNNTEVNEGHQLGQFLSAPASGHTAWCNQTVNDKHRQVSSSAEAVMATPGSNPLGVFHTNQISAGQKTMGFGHLGSHTSLGGPGLEMQQQQMQQQEQMQQILKLLYQQQILQQQLQCQMQQQQMYQVHQYQMQQQQTQPLIHQCQIYPPQMQQQIHTNSMYQQQGSQDQVQHYGQYSTGGSLAPTQSNLPLPAQTNVEYNIHRISQAQHNANAEHFSTSSCGTVPQRFNQPQ